MSVGGGWWGGIEGFLKGVRRLWVGWGEIEVLSAWGAAMLARESEFGLQ